MTVRRVKPVMSSDPSQMHGLRFHCPGCGKSHMPRVGAGAGPRWRWNGSYDRPTFEPSILVRGVLDMTEEQEAAFDRGAPLPEPTPFICHSFVTDGRIQFLNDCTHALAGQTADLPDIDAHH